MTKYDYVKLRANLFLYRTRTGQNPIKL